MKKIIFALLMISCIHFSGQTQVIINEYSCSNMNGPTDAFGEREDWVELYNAGGTVFDLSGFFLSDNDGNLTKWEIPPGATVPANGYTVIQFSGRGLLSGTEIHPDFSLTQTKNEWIILTAPSGAVVDSLKMVKMTQKDHSYGRTTSGASTWSLFTTPTPGAANSGGVNYYTAKPNMSVAPGFYTSTQNVTITTTDPSATIYYTTDGTTPTTSSTVYSGPVSISSTTVLRARCFSSTPSTPPSFVETNTYFINSPHTIPVLSVCGDQITDFLNDVAPGAFSNNFDGAFEFFDKDGNFIDEGEGYYNKHGNDSWAYDQRGFDFVMRDEYGINHAVQHQIFAAKDRDEYQRLMMKAAANDNYPASGGAHVRDAYVHTLSAIGDLSMDERTSEFVIIYVDGQYWGVYDVREKVDDHDFTDHYYNQGKYEIEFIKTWGGTWAEYGDPAMTEWNDLYTYITTNDMSVTANYEYVKSKYNVQSLVDYVVLNSFIVSSDWLNWNTAWWKGNNPDGDKKKWRYALWDNDASFGHYINYTGVPSTDPDADPCNPETLSGGSDPEGHITILNALMANEEFNQLYITRYADLSNGIFSCDQMHAVLDSMIAVITPEMTAHTARWGGTVPGWQANVQTLKDFIDARCAAISSGMIDCYDLTGPFDLTVQVEPVGAGEVKVNSEWIPYYPWTGLYYGNINTLFEANAFTGYEFDHWGAANHTFIYPDSLNDTLDLTVSDTITAYFTEIEVVDPPVTPPGVVPPGDYLGFHLPTAFSPNADDNNDVLQYYMGYDVLSFELKIYDRWGNLLFQTNQNGTYWDGYYKEKLVNTGIYTYTLNYTLTDNTYFEKTGNITVIR